MGAERQRAEAKHKQTQATQDTLTQGRLQAHPHKSAKAIGKQATADNRRPPGPRDKRPRNGARPDTLARLYKPDRPKDALPQHRATPSSRRKGG
jgi:hypothetical protein